MHTIAELQFSIVDPRDSERFDAQISADIRRSGSRAIPALVTDISVTGFCVETEERMPINGVVWLKLGTLSPQIARVMWNRRLVAGCRFDVPLSPYVLDQFIQTGRT